MKALKFISFGKVHKAPGDQVFKKDFPPAVLKRLIDAGKVSKEPKPPKD